MRLFELDKAYRDALENVTIDEETGEVIGEEALDALQGDLHDKWEAYAVVIKERTAEVEALKKEADNLASRIKSGNKAIEWLKMNLAQSMQAADESALKTAKAAITFRNSESVEIVREEDLPERFLKIVTDVKPDKTCIKAAIKDGEEVPGAILVQKRNIQVK